MLPTNTRAKVLLRHLARIVTAVVLGAAVLPGRPAGAATIGLNFTGANQRLSGIDRPDSNGAVGPHHIVEMINGVYTVYDKATGQLLQRMSLNSFWGFAGERGAGPLNGSYDPRVVYDPTVDRWYAAGLPVDSGISLAVSISGDPTFPTRDLSRGWKGFRLDGDPASEPNTRWSDYPSVGFDADGVYITARLLDLECCDLQHPPEHFDSMVVSIPKADLLASTPTVVNRSVFDVSQADALAQGGLPTMQPVINFGPSDGIASLFSINGTTGLRRWDLANTGVESPGQATLSAAAQVPIEPFTHPPNGKQPDNAPPLYARSKLTFSNGQTFDASQFTSALVQQGDCIWGALAVDVARRAGIRWYELDAQSGAVRQEGTVSDRHLDLIYPSVAANAFGDVVIGFTATGEEKFPSAYAVVGDTVHGVTTFGELMELKAGSGTHLAIDDSGRNLWGDYSATVVDPSNPFSFWTFQEFAQPANQWAVQITQIYARDPALINLAPNAIYAVQDNDSDAVFDDLGDAAADALASPRLTVGEGDAAASNRIVRGIAKFALPDTPNPVNRLESATLRFFVESIEGTPAGPLSLLHSLSDNDLDLLASDYEDGSYMDSLLDLVEPTDVPGMYYELDVTDLVLADYLSDGADPLSAFRLQISEASFFEDNLSNRYLLTMPGAEVDRPQLVLTFIPEPSTSILGVMAILGVLGCACRGGMTGRRVRV